MTPSTESNPGHIGRGSGGGGGGGGVGVGGGRSALTIAPSPLPLILTFDVPEEISASRRWKEGQERVFSN